MCEKQLWLLFFNHHDVWFVEWFPVSNAAKNPSLLRMVHLIPKQTSRVFETINLRRPPPGHPSLNQIKAYKTPIKSTPWIGYLNYTTHHSVGSSNICLEGICSKLIGKPLQNHPLLVRNERISKGFTMCHRFTHQLFWGEPGAALKMPSPEAKISYWKQIEFENEHLSHPYLEFFETRHLGFNRLCML